MLAALTPDVAAEDQSDCEAQCDATWNPQIEAEDCIHDIDCMDAKSELKKQCYAEC